MRAANAQTMRHKRTAGGRNVARIFIKTKKILYLIVLIVISVILIFLWIRIDKKMRPAAEKACLYECESLTSRIVSESVSDALEIMSGLELTLSSATYDKNGSITGIHANADAVNTVQTILLEQMNTALNEKRGAEFFIHLGTLTGMHTMAGRGAEIPLRYIPKGSADITLQSNFTSAGINQTIHTLSAEITVSAGCSVPLYQAESTQTYTYLLAETVIVGDVPTVSWQNKAIPAA